MTAEQRTDAFVRQLVRALRNLSSDAESQIAFTHRLGVGVDEIALEFDDVFRQAHGMCATGLLPEQIEDALRPIDSQLQQMTNSRQPVWNEDSVRSSPEWRAVRSLAREALDRLTEQDTK
ncbi:hypothetical protein ACSNOH_20595 [Streptomyces sp. URMC 127]|uniref:hypothetical protein n=1 Tax=Streptomyces sp. URMC 127 TaxID=3423402 RepID=UPI003F1D81E4